MAAEAPRRRADVGITGDRIAAIGDFSAADAGRVIDASNRIVAPGFIDVHTHMDGWLLKRSHVPSKTLQGFTTEVIGLDGISYFPVNPQTAKEWLFYLRALDGLAAQRLRRLAEPRRISRMPFRPERAKRRDPYSLRQRPQPGMRVRPRLGR